MEEFKSIKDWALEDRPREKMIKLGASSLSNAELLAILINTGSRNLSALDISKQLMQLSQHNLLELSKISFTEFKKIKGIGEKKAITIIAALELGKRRQLSTALINPTVNSSREAFEVLSPYYYGKTVEEFYVIYMLQNGKVMHIECISNGGITGTIADVRVIMKRALELKSVTRIIISHNHPSGNLTPSEADKKLTEKIITAAKFFDIQITDHIIVGENEYYSFKDSGIF